MLIRLIIVITATLCIQISQAKQPIAMASFPSLSPDGSKVLFSWNGDIWIAATEGGQSTRLTSHPAWDFAPRFTPDGKSICFGSARASGYQVFIMSVKGGEARQLTHHSEGSFLEDISADSSTILIRGTRDFPGRKPYRLYQISIDGKQPEKMLFPAYAENGRYSKDGKSVVFTREGTKRYRKGYQGTMASQVWTWSKDTKEFNKAISNKYGCRDPFYHPDGSGIFFTQGSPNGFNLWFHDVKTGNNKQVTQFDDDSVMQPHIAADGSSIVFRHLFDLYVLSLTEADAKPIKLDLWHKEDFPSKPTEDLVIKSTKDAAFSPSGLEVIFEAEGDIWAMDTIMRKPHQLTKTLAHEKDLWFSHDGKSILYIYDDGIKTELRRIEKKSPAEFWWQATDLKHTTIVKESDRPTSIIPGPKGKKIAYTTYPGNLWVSKPDGSEAVRLIESWRAPDVEWSPDGKWIAYATQNNNFNSDIYVISADGSSPPVNISRHPDNDFSPAWSPDGRRLAFIGRHHKEEYDLFYLDLYKSDEVKDSDGETLERARKTMSKDPAYKGITKKKVKKAIEKITGKDKEAEKKKAKDEEAFDFVNVHQRLKRIKVKGMTPTHLIWTHDSKKILFQSRTSKKIIYSAEAKLSGKITKFAEADGVPMRMTPKGKLYWLSGGVPSALQGGKNIRYTFTLYDERDLSDWKRMAFRTAWKTMRDSFYDAKLNNRDWITILNKYEDMAATANTSLIFDRIVSMMLGELNASHMGFRSAKTWPKAWVPEMKWKEETVHLGIRFDEQHSEKGWKVSEVIPDSPADRSISKILPGETITHIGDVEIPANSKLTDHLHQRISEPVHLKVVNKDGKERNVKILPTSYKSIRALARNAQIDDTEQQVNKLSGGKLGYIHVARMMWDEFEKFEHHLYEQGAGKDGIVIDVRDNGGGFTTDHLLTALCQPRHAYTIPRNGGIGYPQDRIVYATWNKPIIVLCNQNSFSNAEIFAHAIRNLNRGKVVGVATAGGVISTGSASILDAGTMRLPFRGWFTSHDGKDMELNGAQPHITVWNKPGEFSSGKDVQLEKAVQILLEESKKAPSQPAPKYRAAK
ncbi:MAG: S41 family peptidase [Akkermansiaceae bacterium]